MLTFTSAPYRGCRAARWSPLASTRLQRTWSRMTAARAMEARKRLWHYPAGELPPGLVWPDGQESQYLEEMFAFTGADVSDFVGSVRCTVPPGEGDVHRSGRGDRCRQPDPHHAAGGAGAREDGSRIDKGSDPVVQGLSRSREGGVIRRDEGGAPRFDAPAGGYFRVLFSGFYPQKGYNPSLFVGVLFLGFQSDDLFTGVVAPTTCKSSICLTTCMGSVRGRSRPVRFW